MKKNNKGFMLVEVIITATIVLVSMIALYTSFNKLYNNYNTKNTYYNIDAFYAAKEVITSIIDSGNMNIFINNEIKEDLGYGYIIQDKKITVPLNNTYNYNQGSLLYGYDIIQNLYNIKNIVISKYENEYLENLQSSSINQTFKDYINYIKKYYDIENTYIDYNYIVLTEVEEGDKTYYAALRMR